MLLGSVSQHCVQHAPCPVLVVPEQPLLPSADRTD
jgi:nucleotide-binding universal stress UspA family protein